ncbi:hypothetical protein OSB04_017396 [Centaurea solstitialis]|uniref:Uncharacterized protein n=1 Tax=Centaurea solstitialis TaxID=347529 RepID=A0AA38TG02_9ASTR|nr:hypothetical protein OSB04_017396 [Centaurea solstitialis]
MHALTKEESFNHARAHAQYHNVIECAYGVLKTRFPILNQIHLYFTKITLVIGMSVDELIVSSKFSQCKRMKNVKECFHRRIICRGVTEIANCDSSIQQRCSESYPVSKGAPGFIIHQGNMHRCWICYILVRRNLAYSHVSSSDDLSDEMKLPKYMSRLVMLSRLLSLRHSPRILATTLRSVIKFLSQTASFAASEAAMYSASVVESAIVSCFELFHEIAPPFRSKYAEMAIRILMDFNIATGEKVYIISGVLLTEKLFFQKLSIASHKYFVLARIIEVVSHIFAAVTSACPQNDTGNVERHIIDRTMSSRVRFLLSDTPFICGVYGGVDIPIPTEIVSKGNEVPVSSSRLMTKRSTHISVYDFQQVIGPFIVFVERMLCHLARQTRFAITKGLKIESP